MCQQQTRRNFLRKAPLAVALSLPVADTLLSASSVAAQAPETAAPRSSFQVVPAATTASALEQLQSTPGNKDLAGGKGQNITVTLTVEEKKIAKEFEFHEHREHVFNILDGITHYEIGGTPVQPREVRPGEWLAASCEGFTAVTLKKGDMLTVPKMTPHRRITEGKVSFVLINALISA